MPTRYTTSLADAIVPALPQDYREMNAVQRQNAVDRAKRALQLRRNVIELEGAVARAKGELQVYEADADAVAERIEQEAAQLPEHRVRHLEGRLAVYRAKAAQAVRMIRQYNLELQLYQAIVRSQEDR
jgi:regulator of protease activity HflC (stomatin/prohibitin superfamily)